MGGHAEFEDAVYKRQLAAEKTKEAADAPTVPTVAPPGGVRDAGTAGLDAGPVPADAGAGGGERYRTIQPLGDGVGNPVVVGHSANQLVAPGAAGVGAGERGGAVSAPDPRVVSNPATQPGFDLAGLEQINPQPFMVGSKWGAAKNWIGLGLAIAKWAQNGGLQSMSATVDVIRHFKDHPRTSMCAIATIIASISTIITMAAGLRDVSGALALLTTVFAGGIGLSGADANKVTQATQALDDKHTTNEMRIRALEDKWKALEGDK